VVNNEEGQKGLDASLRNGEGAFGLQGYRASGSWDGWDGWDGWANLRSGLERLLVRVGAGLGGRSRSSSASSGGAARWIEGVLGNGKERVGEVGAAGGGVGGGVVGERAESEALVCMERAAETLGAKLR
jgi:hypothetical protein